MKKTMKLLQHACHVSLFLFLLLGCKEEEFLTAQHESSGQVDLTVLERIASLAFPMDEIRDMGKYYLVEGDLYFSKEVANSTFPTTKKQPTTESKLIFTVRADESIANSEHWRIAIEQAIEEWNSNTGSRVYFVFTNSPTADITVQSANDELPSNVPIASEFPDKGRVGAVIRVNLQGSLSSDMTHSGQMLRALSRCVGFRQTDFNRDKSLESVGFSSNAKTQASSSYIYAIQGDIFFRIDKVTGSYKKLSSGWSGSSHMTGAPNGNLYVLQFGTIYRVNPEGDWAPLTKGWTGTQVLHYGDDGFLYAVQSGTLFSISTRTGVSTQIGASGQYNQTVFMCRSSHGLAVINKTSSSGSLSFVHTIPGDVNFGKKVKVNSGAVWFNTTALTFAGAYIWYTSGSTMFLGFSENLGTISKPKFSSHSNTGTPGIWRGTVAMVGSSDPLYDGLPVLGVSIYAMQSGNLYRFSTVSFRKERLGNIGWWTDTFLVAAFPD